MQSIPKTRMVMRKDLKPQENPENIYVARRNSRPPVANRYMRKRETRMKWKQLNHPSGAADAS